MPEYELTGEDKELLTWLVEANRSGTLAKRFRVSWASLGGSIFEGYSGSNKDVPQFFREQLDALEEEGLLRCQRSVKTKTSVSGKKNPKTYESEQESSRHCTITQGAYVAVDSDFVKPDPEPEQPSNVTNTFNISGDLTNAVVGTHNTANFSGSFNFSNVEQLIEEEAEEEEREELHQLLLEIRSLLEQNQTADKGFLARWNEKIKKYDWLASAVAGWMLNFATKI